MKMTRIAGLCAAAAALACAQQFKFDLSQLEPKASNAVDVSLNNSTLQFAAKFLDTKDPDEARVKDLIAGLQGIYIKSFEFKREGAWSDADIENIRKQLRAPEWSRIVGAKSNEDGENTDVYVRTVDKKVTGVAILATAPKELTVVNIVGPVDLDSLADLGGHFGVPKVEVPKK
jgi:hypothetical protein